jgi:hypothetical protein
LTLGGVPDLASKNCGHLSGLSHHFLNKVSLYQGFGGMEPPAGVAFMPQIQDITIL